MLEFYLDTADVDAVTRFHKCLPVRGVTTNPSILAKAGLGINRILPELASILGGDSRFFVQVVSQTADGMVDEARKINALPYDLVVKVPATETGLAAIKQLKSENIQILATAIYSTHQGFLAALSGADYLAPYVNRIDAMGADGIKVVADLQLLINQYGLATKLLPASFKNSGQVVEVLKLGVAAITLPVDVAAQLLAHPAVQPAVDQFTVDWHYAFDNQLSFES
ncbi:MAG: fructose-6-phosphate aldolase [Methylicorpusculum sp.]|uniref:fructose-6-phosphate aldolase n=1 Tax=Methylicorpusculum sp. TaxID=2713644 RepID=UPI00271E8114|nr:fructose-6-phosphate aldolase [Methylicorpusculum sp.]MDO8937782.1 fructose-6-phosphate aldolase [Methylicorpusculum sp.]MDO9239542.1 fructose-6-phosphate aldolase [Methylicorpusculum sp.]MDP2180594.1 fructose-6-phosphate aldolase [Methylicorpusculum sp.]MDP2201937.1 fructose-6-phosphate aldolase [Methylicorpusculum sp.]MDP3528861.1 fructose-6-phosphate aldolase [Methylicorpusculum sp.]